MNDDDELPYDGDWNDERQRCVHGTFIGSWWGPDYLCQWCEDGVSVDEMRRTLRAQAIHDARRQVQRGEDLCEAFVTKLPYTASNATFLVDIIANGFTGCDEFGRAWRLLNELEGAT